MVSSFKLGASHLLAARHAAVYCRQGLEGSRTFSVLESQHMRTCGSATSQHHSMPWLVQPLAPRGLYRLWPNLLQQIRNTPHIHVGKISQSACIYRSLFNVFSMLNVPKTDPFVEFWTSPEWIEWIVEKDILNCWIMGQPSCSKLHQDEARGRVIYTAHLGDRWVFTQGGSETPTSNTNGQFGDTHLVILHPLWRIKVANGHGWFIYPISNGDFS